MNPEIFSAPIVAAVQEHGRTGLLGAVAAGSAALPWLVLEGEVALSAERVLRGLRRLCRRLRACARPNDTGPYDWAEEEN